MLIFPSNTTNGTMGWQTHGAPSPRYDKQDACMPRAPVEAEVVELEVVDDSWLVVPHDLPQVSLQVGATVARNSGGGVGLPVPTVNASTSAATRRRLALKPASAESGQESSLDGKEARVPVAGEEALLQPIRHPSYLLDGVEAPMYEATRPEEEEDDDHLRHHEEAPELPDLAGMPARVPGRLDEAALGELRAHHAAKLAKEEADEEGRRLQTAPAPLRWSDASTWGGSVPNSSTPIVYIPNGTHVLLDTSAYIRIWVIEGTLSFADEGDVHLEAEAVLVNHGELHVGSAT